MSISQQLPFDGSREFEKYAIGLILAWGVGDTLSTLITAHIHSPAMEGNPLIKAILLTSPLLAVALKLLVALIAAALLLHGEETIRSVPGWRPWILSMIGLGVLVTVSNLLVAVNVL